MKDIRMYEVGEEVYIKAKITEIVVENGEIKYRIKAEHSNNDLDHNYTEHQLFQIEDEITEEEIQEAVSEVKEQVKAEMSEAFRKKYNSSNRKDVIERRK